MPYAHARAPRTRALVRSSPECHAECHAECALASPGETNRRLCRQPSDRYGHRLSAAASLMPALTSALTSRPHTLQKPFSIPQKPFSIPQEPFGTLQKLLQHSRIFLSSGTLQKLLQHSRIFLSSGEASSALEDLLELWLALGRDPVATEAVGGLDQFPGSTRSDECAV